MSKILVTGGAGYIGSHIVALLRAEGRDVWVLDDLSQGHRQAIGDAPLIEADCGDGAALAGLLADGDVESIVHMAAWAEVGQSVEDPAGYYRNNVSRSLALLDAAQRYGVRRIVFSSSCAVYGIPSQLPLEESHPVQPVNPYGETKRVVESALQWYQQAYGIDYVALRYFNAAGAHPSGMIGEDHRPESHLIPRLLGRVAQGIDEPLPIYGTDYPTTDGTCVRDYVHVLDLAQAHLLALDLLRRQRGVGAVYNLGSGEGFSVREVVETVGQVTGRRPATVEAPRRPGDPPILVAKAARARAELGWSPRFETLESIVETAWAWHRSHPDGYDAG